jgi:hypothetical protein
MSNWLKAMAITCLVTSMWMITGEWLQYLRREEVHDEHTLVVPVQIPVPISGVIAVQSAGTRFHMVAQGDLTVERNL